MGCAKNLINTEQMMFLLKREGFIISSDILSANCVLLNTCGFIEIAKSEAIEIIIELEEMKFNGEIKRIIVSGCLSERYKNEIIKEFPLVDAVVGTGSFDEIVSVFNSFDHENHTDKIELYGDINSSVSEVERIITTSPKWTYLKIAEGCDNNCAYCVIPSLRGKFRSRPIENIIAEAEDLAKKGIRELILVAQDSTNYGVDLYKRKALVELLKRLCYIRDIEWIRLHYLYPSDIDDYLIDFIAEHDKILKYLDIPVQHINDCILSKMNRRGTGDQIRTLFTSVRKKIPGVVLRTSLITGLPGETEKEFIELCDFVTKTKIERAGVFVYSPEEGTSAALMEKPDSVITNKRAEILRELQSKIMDEYDRSRIGSTTRVLIEGLDEDGFFYGRSYAESPEIDGYIVVDGDGITINEFIDVYITETADGILRGVPKKT